MKNTPDLPGRKYRAFISYSSQDNLPIRRDGSRGCVSWASWLQDALESYRVPAPLLGQMSASPRERQDRIFPVFRDITELACSPSLQQEIREALSQSEFLILIASPRSAASAYVDDEVRYFQSLGRGDRILALIIDGDPGAAGPGHLAGGANSQCFCPALLRQRLEPEDGALSAGESLEPLAADARIQDGAALREPRARDLSRREVRRHLELAKLKIIARLLGVKLDELIKRDQAREVDNARRAARRLRLWLGAVSTLAVAATVLAAVAHHQRRQAQKANEVAQHRLYLTSITRAAEQVRRGNLAEASRTLTFTPETWRGLPWHWLRNRVRPPSVHTNLGTRIQHCSFARTNLIWVQTPGEVSLRLLPTFQPLKSWRVSTDPTRHHPVTSGTSHGLAVAHGTNNADLLLLSLGRDGSPIERSYRLGFEVLSMAGPDPLQRLVLLGEHSRVGGQSRRTLGILDLASGRLIHQLAVDHDAMDPPRSVTMNRLGNRVIVTGHRQGTGHFPQAYLRYEIHRGRLLPARQTDDVADFGFPFGTNHVLTVTGGKLSLQSWSPGQSLEGGSAPGEIRLAVMSSDGQRILAVGGRNLLSIQFDSSSQDFSEYIYTCIDGVATGMDCIEAPSPADSGTDSDRQLVLLATESGDLHLIDSDIAKVQQMVTLSSIGYRTSIPYFDRSGNLVFLVDPDLAHAQAEEERSEREHFGELLPSTRYDFAGRTMIPRGLTSSARWASSQGRFHVLTNKGAARIHYGDRLVLDRDTALCALIPDEEKPPGGPVDPGTPMGIRFSLNYRSLFEVETFPRRLLRLPDLEEFACSKDWRARGFKLCGASPTCQWILLRGTNQIALGRPSDGRVFPISLAPGPLPSIARLAQKPSPPEGHLPVAVDDSASRLVTRSTHGAIRLWRVDKQGAILSEIVAFDDGSDLSYAYAFSPDGRLLACGGRHLTLVDADSGVELVQLASYGGHGAEPQSGFDLLVFSPDSGSLFAHSERYGLRRLFIGDGK